MEKKNGIVSALTDSVKTKKHITTKIEYFCNDTDDAERVFVKGDGYPEHEPGCVCQDHL